eukprot:snap_masked-scaffold_10-processed-gene-10.5-mRNA-1 protein AED:1.00 eAED:1.00 QI:0/0/0/0/1/1/2/0/110
MISCSIVYVEVTQFAFFKTKFGESKERISSGGYRLQAVLTRPFPKETRAFKKIESWQRLFARYSLITSSKVNGLQIRWCILTDAEAIFFCCGAPLVTNPSILYLLQALRW